ncbi:MAG: thermonuclease family protein [Syntrophobacteraceae bacterium]
MFTKFRTIFLSLLIVILAGSSTAAGFAGPKEGRVKAVIDGDTVVLETGARVRYLGVDSPEIGHDGDPSDCHGNAAKGANSDMVLGRKVDLSYERAKTDSHGRFLAYVFLPDGTCVNLELLRSGNAFIYRTADGFTMFQEFMAAQREAIKERRGLWGACSVRPAAGYVGNRHTFVLHRHECDLAGEMSARNRRRFGDRWSAFGEGFRPCRMCKP